MSIYWFSIIILTITATFVFALISQSNFDTKDIQEFEAFQKAMRTPRKGDSK